jgi:hypothetical protein
VLDTKIDHIGLTYLVPTSTLAVAAAAAAVITSLTGSGSATINMKRYTAMLNRHASVADAKNSLVDHKNSGKPVRNKPSGF